MSEVTGQKSAEVVLPEASRGLEDVRLNYETGSLDSGKDRTDPMNRPHHPSTTTNPTGGARNGNGSQAEKESSCKRSISLFDQALDSKNLLAALEASQSQQRSTRHRRDDSEGLP